MKRRIIRKLKNNIPLTDREMYLMAKWLRKTIVPTMIEVVGKLYAFLSSVALSLTKGLSEMERRINEQLEDKTPTKND